MTMNLRKSLGDRVLAVHEKCGNLSDMFKLSRKNPAGALPKDVQCAPYPARFPTLSSVFFLFSLFINYGVQLGRSGTFPADGNEALISLYVFVLVGCIPFVISGGSALVLRSFQNQSFKCVFDKILVKVNGLLGVLLLISAAVILSR